MSFINSSETAWPVNVHDPVGQATYCPACGAMLIGRNQYDVTAWSVDSLDIHPPCRAGADRAEIIHGRTVLDRGGGLGSGMPQTADVTMPTVSGMCRRTSSNAQAP